MSDELTVPQVVDDLTDFHEAKRALKDVLSGTAGGIAQVLVGQPFDITKVRLQTSTQNTSALEVVKSLIRNEGILGFYKGTMAPLVGVGACVSCQFGTNEAMKRFFRRRNDGDSQTLNLWQYYVCGAVSGSANAFLATPIEHVRIRLQLQTKTAANAAYSGSLDCFKKLLKRGSLMRGFSATIMRTSHGFGVYFLTYESLIAREAHKGVERKDIPSWKVCLYGAASGACFWAMTYPFDVIKSVMQSDNLKSPVYGSNPWQVAKSIYKERGARAFIRGFTPAMLRSLPVNGATFATFELTMRLLK
ncbi:LAMI_0E16248g1_1 [Lachancea mirantina]|uniref:LAMI_0E16248g1_1 n=1 Tax=Lachancea mirantina TaxID=1230905 RepID=A0A1G4JTB9_9SACH|nr:LAMI_0E16248g1_1 [Lachancea mirantina]